MSKPTFICTSVSEILYPISRILQIEKLSVGAIVIFKDTKLDKEGNEVHNEIDISEDQYKDLLNYINLVK